MSDHHVPSPGREGPDWSGQAMTWLVVAIIVVGSLGMAATGWPEPLFLLHLAAGALALVFAARAAYVSLDGDLEEGFLTLLSAFILALWFFYGPKGAWLGQPVGYDWLDPALMVIMGRRPRLLPGLGYLPVCFIPVITRFWRVFLLS